MTITERAITNGAKRLKSLIRRPLLDVYRLDGIRQGEPFRTIVADDGSTMFYLRSLVYNDDPKVQPQGKITSVAAPGLANADADLVCIGANQFLRGLYKNSEFKLIPKWVRLHLPVTEHPDVLIAGLRGESGGSVRRMVRKMKENDFSYEITRDSSWFDDFYTNMYEPYARNRFGPTAVTDSYERVRKLFARGSGLVVKRHDRPVGGVVIFQRGSTLWFHRVGIADGNEGLTRDGASVAMYYFTILHAYLSGCDGVDFGHSRPFLSDGALRYKLKWGMRAVDEDDSIGAFAVTAPAASEAGRRFMQENKCYEFTHEGIRHPDES